jgi:putative membrane protein
VSGLSPQPEPDYRFTLANERTFLAYLRTALALEAGGLVLAQYLHDLGTPAVRRVVALVVLGAGLVTVVAGYLRWRANHQAIRRARPLPRTPLPLALTVVTVVVTLTAALLLA